MIKGLKYGLIFYLIVPWFVFVLSKGDFSFLLTEGFYSKKYGFDFSFFYISLFIFISIVCLIFYDPFRGKKIDINVVNRELFFLRRNNKYIFFLNILVFVTTFINIFYIDHSVYWLDREPFSFFPYYIEYYIFPIVNFILFLSVIGLVVYIKIYIKLIFKLKFYLKSFVWFIVDLVVVSGTIYNSGNRWWIALIFFVFFMLSSRITQKIILFLFPILCVVGSIISLIILSSRVVQDPVEIIKSSLSAANVSNFLFETIIFSTEGINFAALLEVSNISLFDPDLSYFFKKIIYTPLPGWLVEKPLVFNLLVSYLIIGYYSNYSINSTLFGSFVYSFGLFSIFLFLIFIFILKFIDNKFQYSSLFATVLFSVSFAGFRFGFDYIFINIIYFYFIMLFIMSSLSKRKKTVFFFISNVENRKDEF